ncbi:VIT1/CCC1 transporter family protein [Bradyrhizobium sp.]|uniref:VIT1/CCC1 transporter family protein n=1 Tax=Bradyrhizobium sp. TaxID=376 RepID=UPI002D4968A9|nr:VIT1/CCC1 transporter family protein [Bradyrhizobium sp.]HZR76129.1 VIT1/CCC1 transporter family protein [Bradyrhizobium sp.]
MKIGSTWQRLRDSVINSAGTIVFGMEDGTVSIFGLIFGVAATTSSTKTVLIAGASGAAAAAVSMMAGAYLDAETTRDKTDATRLAAGNSDLSSRLVTAGLTPLQSKALSAAAQSDRNAADGLLLVLEGASKERVNPFEQALWMLIADFFAAAVPILPFVLLPIGQARIVSGVVTVALLVALGVGRAKLGRRSIIRTVTETVSLGIGAAAAGVGIGVLIDHLLS